MHAIAAGALSAPELAIDGEEAKLIAGATAEVARHYNIAPDEKTQAWINLAMALGAVYGPRAFVMLNKPKRSAATAAAAPFGAAAAAAAAAQEGATEATAEVYDFGTFPNMTAGNG